MRTQKNRKVSQFRKENGHLIVIGPNQCCLVIKRGKMKKSVKFDDHHLNEN